MKLQPICCFLLIRCSIGLSLGGPSTKQFDLGTGARLRVNNLQQPPIESARHYIYFAATAYCTNTTALSNWTCKYCTKNRTDIQTVKVFSNQLLDTFGFVAVDTLRNEIIVSVRGSASLLNYLEDVVFIPIPAQDPRILVHAGFYLLTLSVYDQVITILRDLMSTYSINRIVITGHSLGGGMAALTTYKLITSNVFPDATYSFYTYGSPRVGNRAYATKFNSFKIPSARVVHYSDLVAHLPPSIVGYFHHQNELWIFEQKGNTAKYCSQTVYEDPKCSNSLGPNYTITDHRLYFDVNLESARAC